MLEKIKFVRRSWNPNSRREILINIKDEGRSVLREIKECREEAFISRLKYLSDSEVDELYYINVQLLKNYVEENKKDLKLIPMGDNALGYLIRYEILLEKEIMFKA